MIILPRQARDKHRESTHTECGVFLQAKKTLEHGLQLCLQKCCGQGDSGVAGGAGEDPTDALKDAAKHRLRNATGFGGDESVEADLSMEAGTGGGGGGGGGVGQAVRSRIASGLRS